MLRRRGNLVWTPDDDRLLGTDHDRVIARRLKCSVTPVRLRRIALGIPAFRNLVWTPDDDRLLGTDLDRVIARKLKCSVTAVRLRRVALGIGTFHPKPTPADEFIPLLGTMPDARLAALRGVTYQAIQILRKKHGIAAYGRRPVDRSGQTVGEATILGPARGQNRFLIRCRCGRMFERDWPFHSDNPLCGKCGSNRGENLTGRTWHFLKAVEYRGIRDGTAF
jgi:hypothetical protein